MNMNMNNRVSILIPAYNRADFIHETIDDCFKQTYKDFEIIIYDDGSIDNTEDIVKSYKKNVGIDKKSRIKYIKSKTNLGVGSARNALLDYVNTEFACWLDSDDSMPVDRLERCINYMDSNPDTDVVYSNIQWFSGTNKDMKFGEVIKADVSKYDRNDFRSIAHNSTCATAFFKSNLKSYKFLEGIKLGGEDSLWLWDLILADKKFGYINHVLYYYRSHGNRIGIIKRKPEYLEMKDKEGLLVHNYLNNKMNKDESTK